MPAETKRIFVALRPDEPLDALVRGYKRRLLAAAGPQLYATDPPHTTLYLAEFAARRVSRVMAAVERLAGSIPMPAVALAGWHVFERDPLTGLSTLVCRFDEESCQRLRWLQLCVIGALAPLHDRPATQEKLLAQWPALTDEQRQRGLLFGFPYVGGGWIPHLTIASVRPSEWEHVGQVFHLSHHHPGQVENLSYFSNLDVFELHGLEPRLLAAFPLAGPIGKVA